MLSRWGWSYNRCYWWRRLRLWWLFRLKSSIWNISCSRTTTTAAAIRAWCCRTNVWILMLRLVRKLMRKLLRRRIKRLLIRLLDRLSVTTNVQNKCRWRWCWRKQGLLSHLLRIRCKRIRLTMWTLHWMLLGIAATTTTLPTCRMSWLGKAVKHSSTECWWWKHGWGRLVLKLWLWHLRHRRYWRTTHYRARLGVRWWKIWLRIWLDWYGRRWWR